MGLGRVPSTEDDGTDGVFSEINITPLTDIFLVLLIIFMVTSSVIVNAGQSGAKAGLKVNLPKGGAADVTPQSNDISVAILSDGRLVLAGDVVTVEELKAGLQKASSEGQGTNVIVQADEGVPHGKVVEVMEMAKSVGLGQLVIGVREGPTK